MQRAEMKYLRRVCVNTLTDYQCNTEFRQK